MKRSVSTALLLAIVFVSASVPALAQGVRGDFRSSVSWIEYRPLVRETVPESLVAGDGTTRVLPDGTVVVCIPGEDCYYYRPGNVADTSPIVHDLRFTAWPGWRGVSSRVHLRARTGGDLFWPRSGQELLALNAYVDFDRADWRVRAGRQDLHGGLGTYYMDGAAVQWRGLDDFRVDIFAGRSLARNIIEPRTGSLLEESDDLPPDKASILWGMQGRVQVSSRLAGTLLYQREIRTDRGGLYSERMALDAALALSQTTLEFSSDYDVAEAAFNDARLRIRRNVSPRVDLNAQARYYRPFFELWTIWGAFSPVGFREARLSSSWKTTPDLRLEIGGSYRDYEDTSTEAEFIPIEGDGWHLNAQAAWRRAGWSATLGTDVHRGFGAYTSRIDFSGGREIDARTYVGIHAVGTQQFAEFRYGNGVTRGAGIEVRTGRGRVTLDGSLGLYRHTFDNSPRDPDYNQGRGRVGLTLMFGAEPGLPKNVYGKAAGS